MNQSMLDRKKSLAISRSTSFTSRYSIASMYEKDRTYSKNKDFYKEQVNKERCEIIEADFQAFEESQRFLHRNHPDTDFKVKKYFVREKVKK